MAFQPAVISASNGLLAPPAAGASNAAPSSSDAGLFQSLLAGAAGETPVNPATPNAVAQTAPTSGALALVLQTQDAQPALAAPVVSDDATPAATLPAAFSVKPVEGAPKSANPATTPQTLPATPAVQNVSLQSPPQTEESALTTDALVATQAAIAAPEQPAPAQSAVAVAVATTTAAQAIIFAPFVAAQTPSTQPTATPLKNIVSTAVEADAPPQNGPFKKTSFASQTKTDTFGGAVAKLAGDALAAPQTQTQARTETAQPGSASPITGFDASRPATESISTPVARALHGAAAMQVAQHVARRFDGQSANFEVRLDPAELGRVDVKITVDHDKRVTAAVSADSAQTLSDLRGAARDIERALNEAGLDLAQGGLSFDLNQRQASDEKIDAAPYASADADEGSSAETVTIAARPFGMERWSASGVDVWT